MISAPQPIITDPLESSVAIVVTLSNTFKGTHCCTHVETHGESEGVRPKTCTLVP